MAFSKYISLTLKVAELVKPSTELSLHCNCFRLTLISRDKSKTVLNQIVHLSTYINVQNWDLMLKTAAISISRDRTWIDNIIA